MGHPAWLSCGKLPDRHSYDYAGHRLAGRDPDAPTMRCEPRGPVPLPAGIPAITWRAGLGLNPLDITRDDDVRWLSCLVWPGEGGPPGTPRRRASTVRRLGAVWLSSEAPGVLPGTAGPAPGADPLSLVLARDGDVFACADSHGAWLEWRP